MMNTLKKSEVLQPYLVDAIKPITSLKTIQIIVFREVLDYTVLRTEEDREINSATTVRSVKHTDVEVSRAVFYGSKQKAVESRQLERLLRTAVEEAGLSYDECYLKDHLCLSCPRCGIYGGTNASSAKGGNVPNIKHRIAYSSAFSVSELSEVREATTFNGISDLTQTTGQTLGERVSVRPGVLFPSVVTLQAVTWYEFVLVVKTLLSSKKYGAESRIAGNVRNHIVGIVAAWEEVITSLELTLELADQEEYTGDQVKEIIDKYSSETGSPNKVKNLSNVEVDQVLEEVRAIELNKAFLEKAYGDVKAFRGQQEK